jgi:copper(I)-binding protein
LNKVVSLPSSSALALIACFMLAYPSHAPAQSAPPLSATEAWVRVTPGSEVAAAYMTLHNASRQPVTIVGVESPIASMAMIHESKVESGVARMRPHEQLVIPPGQTVKLEPDGLHVMLHGVAKTLAPGASVPLVLRLADGTTLQIVALVRPLNAQ